MGCCLRGLWSRKTADGRLLRGRELGSAHLLQLNFYIFISKDARRLDRIRGVGKIELDLMASARLAAVIAALVALCICALAEEDEEEDSADSWREKGLGLFSNGSMEEALQTYDEALKIDPEKATFWLDKSLIHDILARQSRLKAVALFDEDLAEDPEDARSWFGRGVALFGLERPEEAEESWERALEIYNETLESDPEDAEAWFEKAEVLISLGRDEEAIEAYDRAIEQNSTRSADAAMTKGNLLMEMGRLDESLEAFDEAQELIPPDDEQALSRFWSTKAAALHQMNRTEVVEAAFSWTGSGEFGRWPSSP